MTRERNEKIMKYVRYQEVSEGRRKETIERFFTKPHHTFFQDKQTHFNWKCKWAPTNWFTSDQFPPNKQAQSLI